MKLPPKRQSLLVALVIAVFPSLASADPARLERYYGAWAVMTVTDPMTDETWYGTTTHSIAGADFQVSCHWNRPNYLYISFTTKEFLGSGYRDAIYRVDSKTAHTITGSYDDHRVVPLCDGSCKAGDKLQPELTLTSEIKGGTNLLLRVSTYKYQSLDFSFPIIGAQEAVGDVLAKCTALAAEKKKLKR